jgi:hypothetical protein
MEIQPQNTQPISDDQELAKVLAGVNKQVETELADPMAMARANVNAPVAAGSVSDLELTSPVATPEQTPVELVAEVAPTTPEIVASETGLDGVKVEAINELRPLMDKLVLPAEEKFDLYLLIIRSTDDKTLIAPAHEAAKLIADDTRRANALVDIIKEIDYLSTDKKDLAIAA